MAPFLLLLLLLSLLPPSLSQTCTTQKFTNNQLYTNCLDLPSLTSYLHFTYDSTNTTLSLAFISTPPNSNGWIAWALNPSSLKMPGSQALVAFKDSSGSLTVKTYNISSYTSASVVQSNLSFDVWDKSATSYTSTSGSVIIFAKIKVPADLAAKGSINQVWQVGPSVDSSTGALTPHEFGSANLKAAATLDLNGGSATSGGGGGGVDSRTKKKNIHGVLNVVSWGILLPVGVIIARYMRVFESADPAWFYAHVSCQLSAYAIGVAGWATGMKLGSESKGIVFTGHRNIGITLFALATLQIFALFLRPKKDHKIRSYWNVYHWVVGYAIIILGIVNIFKGFNMLKPEKKWKVAYIIVIVVLAVVAALLEVITWSVVLRRKSKMSTKPYDGNNNNLQREGRQQPLNA